MILEWPVLLLLLTVFAGLVCASLVGVLWSALTLLVRGAPRVSMKAFSVLVLIFGVSVTNWLYGDLKVAFDRIQGLLKQPILKATVFDRNGRTLGALTVNTQQPVAHLEVLKDHQGIPLLVETLPELAGKLLLLQEDRYTLAAVNNDLRASVPLEDCMKTRFRAAISVSRQFIKTGSLRGGSGVFQLVQQFGITAGETDVKGKLVEEILGFRLCASDLPVSAVARKVLDQATFGPGVVGFSIAARIFFSQSANQLSVAQQAFLVALIPNPGRLFNRQSSHVLLSNTAALIELAADWKWITVAEKQTALYELRHLQPTGWDQFGAVGHDGALTRVAVQRRLSERLRALRGVRCMLEYTARELSGRLQDLNFTGTPNLQVFTSWANLQVPLPNLQSQEQTVDAAMDMTGRMVYLNGEPTCQIELYIGSLVKPLVTAILMDQGVIPIHGVTINQQPRSGIRNVVERTGQTTLGDALIFSDNLYFYELCRLYANAETYQTLQHWLGTTVPSHPLSCVGIGQQTNPQTHPVNLLSLYLGLVTGFKPHSEPSSIIRVMGNKEYLLVSQDQREPLSSPRVSQSMNQLLAGVAKAKNHPVRLMKSGTFGDRTEIYDRAFVQQAGEWIWVHSKGSHGSLPIQYPEAAVRHHLQTLQRALSKVKP